MDVAILDDSEDLRLMLELALARGLGMSCVSLASVTEMKARRGDVLSTRLALLDVNLGHGEPSGLDAYAWLRAEGFRGAVVFFTGHARAHPLVREAEATGQAVLEKPLPARELLAVVRRIMLRVEVAR